MPLDMQFWVDPACPWCWRTARWVVEEVAPHRDLAIRWRPISLLFKNEPAPDSPYYGATMRTHRALRVMEAIRAEHGDEPIQSWYWQCATRIHHDEEEELDIEAALGKVGLDTALAAAADDERWDATIRSHMDDALALVGDQVGTPILAFDTDGTTHGIFGPVITRVPQDSLGFWDALLVFATTDGFWELKRTRTERPQFGGRPDV